jgi:hypothetical protein
LCDVIGVVTEFMVQVGKASCRPSVLCDVIGVVAEFMVQFCKAYPAVLQCVHGYIKYDSYGDAGRERERERERERTKETHNTALDHDIDHTRMAGLQPMRKGTSPSFAVGSNYTKMAGLQPQHHRESE